MYGTIRFSLALLLMGIIPAFVTMPPVTHGSVRLEDNLGRHHYSISTNNPQAQRYFDQGLIWAFGFNHAEAARSFKEAARLDPACAMCFWGEALVLGPNINAPMSPSAVPRAYKAIHQALTLTTPTSKKEQALIQALATRYSKNVVSDRRHLDQAYADAMRAVFRRFPSDAVIGALFAEALMDLHPWNFWKKSGEAQPWTAEIISTLESVLSHSPDHPLANHLYIHALEASPHPETALPNARRLETLVPGSSHLVHMPAHIYIRVGQYRDAILVNQRAVAVDKDYLRHDHAEGLYILGYIPHNAHFLWAAATKTGQQALAMQAAEETASHVKPGLIRTPGLNGTLQHFWLMPLYTKALFGMWDEILQEPAPPQDLLYPTGIWHYARGLAFTRQGTLTQAMAEHHALAQLLKEIPRKDYTIFDLNDVSQILAIAEATLAGEISFKYGQVDTAVSHLERAVKLDDGLNYTEPKDWYLPPRQVLGAMLLESGNPVKAEEVYREDLRHHPQNGWSLFGLMQSLQAQEKTQEAMVVQQQFKRAWEDADVTLTSSRF